MLPLVTSKGVGSGFSKAMASVVVGGQTLSLLLTLVAIPVLYTLFMTRPAGYRAGGAETRCPPIAARPRSAWWTSTRRADDVRRGLAEGISQDKTVMRRTAVALRSVAPA
jgi:hypothetical protein